MVHRPADSRLLSNLLQQEKEYSKQIGQIIEASNASLASFAAYAAASSPPTSQVIMAVAGSLAAADESFRRYATGVDVWREAMRSLKDAEEEVGNIMRDREILVTRLIKASKPKNGSGSIRDSLLSGLQHFPSASSLSVGNTEAPPPTSSRPLSPSFVSSTKLAAAQSELQACEAHLALKERELEAKRNSVLRDGLGARIHAMIDCGWAWHELGKGALQSLNELKPEQAAEHKDILMGAALSSTLRVPDPESARPSSEFSSIGPSQSASQIHAFQELPPPVSMAAVMSSGAFGEVVPKQPTTPAQPETHMQALSSHNSSGTGSSIFSNPVPATYQVETVNYAAAISVRAPSSTNESETHTEEPKADYTSIPIPAPHALEGYAYGIPTATAPPPVPGPSGLQHTYRMHNSGYSTPQRTTTPQYQPLVSAFHSVHTLERRITEEDDRRRLSAVPSQDDDANSFEELNEEQKLVQEGKLAVVENPRFMSEARKREIEKEKERVARKQEEEMRRLEKGKHTETEEREREPVKEKKRFAFFHHHPKPDKHEPRTVTFAPSISDTHDHQGERVSPSKGFFGSIRGLFSARPLVPGGHPTSSPARSETHADDEYSASDIEPSPSKAPSRSFQYLFKPSDKSKVRPSAAPWETRTDKNIRHLARRGSFDEPATIKTGRVGLGLAGNAAVSAGVVNATGVGLQNGPRGRTVSDSGAVSSTSRAERGPSHGGKRLKKPSRVGSPTSTSGAGRGGDRRSASVDERGESRKSQMNEPEGGEGMIIDLGRRRRVASEVSTPTAELTKRRAPTKQAFAPEPAVASTSAQPVDVFGPTQAMKGYSSDTAAMQPTSTAVNGAVKKKKSLTKKREQVAPPAPAAPVAITTPTAPAPLPITIPTAPKPAAAPAPAPSPAVSTPTPTRRSSIRSNVPSSKSPLSQQTGSATVLTAGGENPSGVLVQQPGWDAQAQALGGTLSRHNSTTSAASAPQSGSSSRNGKKTPLGQGMGSSGGVARRASLSGASPGRVDVPSRAANVNAKAPTASLIQPLPPALNLMSIIEDVARTNREGWTPRSKTRKSVGGSQMPAGMMEIVKAPPPMGRAKLEAMDVAEIRHLATGSTMTSPTMAGATSQTGMFEIKAPGSVFDPRQAEVAPKRSAPSQPATVSQGIKHTHSVRSDTLAVPLRSALRNSSRSPSPADRPLRTVDQSSRQQFDEPTLPPPVDGMLPWGSDGALHRPQKSKADKSKAAARQTDETDQSGDESNDNEVFYSDLEEVESGSGAKPAPSSQVQPEPRTTTEAPAILGMNGHAIAHTKTTSEVSQSTTSTAQQQTPQGQSPRRRKSVRVSLQPTFSPSPPAIEYDDEEQRSRAPTPRVWRAETGDGASTPSGSRRPHPTLAAPLLSAPVPLRAPVKTVAPGEPDMWADSSDEDEEYTRAKRALTRAARKERDTKTMVANSML